MKDIIEKTLSYATDTNFTVTSLVTPKCIRCGKPHNSTDYSTTDDTNYW